MPLPAWYPLRLIQQIAAGEKSLADISEQAARWNVTEVALYDGLLAPVGPFTPTTVRQLFSAAGVRIALLLCAPDFATPFLSVRQKEHSTAERYVDIAAQLGAAAVRFTAGAEHPGIRREDALGIASENLIALSRIVEERGLVCCVENIIRDTRWESADISAVPDAFRALLKRLEGAPIQVLFNTGNPPLMGSDTLTALADVPQDRLYGVHLSDRAVPNGDYGALGDGPTPWTELKAALRARGFDGFVGFVDGQIEGEDASLRSLRFARTWLTDGE